MLLSVFVVSSICKSKSSRFILSVSLESKSFVCVVESIFSKFCKLESLSTLESFTSSLDSPLNIILSKALFRAALNSSKASSSVFVVAVSCVACLLSVSSSPLKSMESISCSTLGLGVDLGACVSKSISISPISSNSFLSIAVRLSVLFSAVLALDSILSSFSCVISLCKAKDSKSILSKSLLADSVSVSASISVVPEFSLILSSLAFFKLSSSNISSKLSFSKDCVSAVSSALFSCSFALSSSSSFFACMNFLGLGCNKSLSSSLKNKSSSSSPRLSAASFASSSICAGIPKLAAFRAEESTIESRSKFAKSSGLSLLGFKSLKSLSNIEPTLCSGSSSLSLIESSLLVVSLSSSVFSSSVESATSSSLVTSPAA